MSNDAVLDTVVQANLLTLGLTSSNAAANLTTAMSQSIGLSFQNGVANQQQTFITHQSSGVQGRNSMFATGLTAANSIVREIDE